MTQMAADKKEIQRICGHLRHLRIIFILLFALAFDFIIPKPGGDGRNRTDDPLLAKQVLYQLSYIPLLR